MTVSADSLPADGARHLNILYPWQIFCATQRVLARWRAHTIFFRQYLQFENLRGHTLYLNK